MVNLCHNDVSCEVIIQKVTFEVACSFFRKTFVYSDGSPCLSFKWTGLIHFFFLFIDFHVLDWFCTKCFTLGPKFAWMCFFKSLSPSKHCFDRKILKFYFKVVKMEVIAFHFNELEDAFFLLWISLNYMY